MIIRAFILVFFGFFSASYAGEPVLSLTSDTPKVYIIQGHFGTVIYNIKSNWPPGYTPFNYYFFDLPTWITHIEESEPNSCTAPTFNLAPGADCNASLYIDTLGVNLGTYDIGPVVCYKENHCYQPNTTPQLMQVKVVSSDNPDLPKLELVLPSGECDTASPANCYIIREITNTQLVVEVKNTGPSDAFDVQVDADVDLALVSPSSCPVIPANGGTCTVTFTAHPTGSASGFVTFGGFNTVQVGFSLTVQEHGISVLGDLNFTTPGAVGQQTLTITNLTTLPTTINSLTVSPSVHDVSEVSDDCTILPPEIGATCTATYEADVNAYGNGTLTVNYGYTGSGAPGPFNIATTVGVSDVTVTINGNQPIIYFGMEENDHLVPIFNWGPFGLQSPNFSLIQPEPPIPLSVNNVNCANPIPPNTSCNANLHKTGDLADFVDDVLPLTMTGTNLTAAPGFPTSRNIQIARGISIAKVISNPNVVGGVGTHLQYQAFAVGNTLEDDVKLNDINVNANASFSGKIGVCTPTPAGSNTVSVSDCDGYNSPSGSQLPICQENEILSTNEMCIIWIKAVDDRKGLSSVSVNNTGLQISIEFEILEDQPHFYTLTQDFTLKYAMSVFAGGVFSTLPSPSPSGRQRVVRWTGNTSPLAWISMDTTNFDTNSIEALQIYKGDLYAAGQMVVTGLGRYILRWDGTDWSRPGGAVGNIAPFNARVLDLAVGADNLLYAAGEFAQVTNGTTSGSQFEARRVASWNGQIWSAIPASPSQQITAVRAIGATFYNNQVCVAAIVDASNTGIVYCFNGTTWVSLGNQSFVTFANTAITTYRGVTNDPSLEVVLLVGNNTMTPGGGLIKYYNGSWTTVPDNNSRLLGGSKTMVASMPPPLGSDVNPGIYVGGGFTNATPSNGTLNRITNVLLNATGNATSAWQQLANTTSPSVTGIGLNTVSNTRTNATAFGYPTSSSVGLARTVIYVGGIFGTVAGDSPTGITAIDGAYWNSAGTTSKWNPLPSTTASADLTTGNILALTIGAALCVQDGVTTCPNF